MGVVSAVYCTRRNIEMYSFSAQLVHLVFSGIILQKLTSAKIKSCLCKIFVIVEKMCQYFLLIRGTF